MIENINLENFKCFTDLSLSMRPLTLLTGFNAAGKSTAMQALLVIAQTCKEKINTPELIINGSLINLGTPGEIINDQASDNLIRVKIQGKNESLAFGLTPQSDRNARLTINQLISQVGSKTETLSEPAAITKELQEASTMSSCSSGCLRSIINETIFISATRKGAIDLYPAPREWSLANADVGANGEYAAWWFAKFLDEDVPEERCHPSDSAKTLRRQFNAWASSIFPGVEANANPIPKTDLVSLEFKSGPTDNWRRPGNIGYGLTYVFPIIVAGLLAKEGQTIFIDSPEAHLHPLGQSKIGIFLSKIAESGVQIIIETHSDHILNGARIAANQSIIKSEDMIIHFFKGGRQEAGAPPPIVTSLVAPDGSLSDWPDGFFDQAEKDLAELAGWNYGKTNN